MYMGIKTDYQFLATFFSFWNSFIVFSTRWYWNEKQQRRSINEQNMNHNDWRQSRWVWIERFVPYLCFNERQKSIQWYQSVHALDLLGDECRNIMVTFLQFWKQYLDCKMKEYLLDVDTMQNNPWCVGYRIDDSFPAHSSSQCYVHPHTIRHQTNTTGALLGALSTNSNCEDTCHIDDSNDLFLSL